MLNMWQEIHHASQEYNHLNKKQLKLLIGELQTESIHLFN